MKVTTLLVALALGLGIAVATNNVAGAQTALQKVLMHINPLKRDAATIESQLKLALSAAGQKLTQAQIDQTTRQIQLQLAAAGGTAEGKVRVDAWGLVIEVEW